MVEIAAMFTKGNTEVLDYTIYWAKLLGTDTIASSSWSVPTGITSSSNTNTTTTTTIWLSGGAIETEYQVENTIVTAGGRTHVRTLLILVIDR